MTMTRFEYARPTALADALHDLAEYPEARVLAGGMSLLPLMKMELATPERLIDLGRVEELQGITEIAEGIRIGAMTRHYRLAADALIARDASVVAQAAAHVGDPQVRHRGTIGGSLAHADPAADLPAAVLAADAVIEAASTAGTRMIPAADFFVGPLVTALQPGEMIVAVRVPRQRDRRQHYEKVPHPASGYAVVGVAVSLALAEGRVRDARIGVTGTAGHAFRARAAERVLEGESLTAALIAEASGLVADEAEILGDSVYASAEYRRHLLQVSLSRALQRVA